MKTTTLIGLSMGLIDRGTLGALRMRLIAPLILLLLLMFAGAASATDYYVATWGDNTTQGNITHPWQNVSYATQQAVAGDTIYLFNGTWYDEHAVFANSGNATHPITLTAYNGTPELDGVDKSGAGIKVNSKDHIHINGLEIRNYQQTINWPGSYMHVSNCVLWNTTDINGGQHDVVIVLTYRNSTNNTIENCTLYNSGWNTIQVSANLDPAFGGTGVPTTNTTIRNCTVYNSKYHNAIDLYGHHQYITIEDCEFYSNAGGTIFTHDYPDVQKYVTIQNNYFHDTIAYAIKIDHTNYSCIHNNTFRDTGSDYPLYSSSAHDIDITNNSFYNTESVRVHDYNYTFNWNYMESSAQYQASWGGQMVVKNPLGYVQLWLGDGYSEGEWLYDDGTVFTAGAYNPYSYIPVRYYPDKSNISAVSKSDNWATIYSDTIYSITLRPTNDYLKDVTVNHASDTTDDRTNISVNSSVSTNPTWINATMQNTSNTYNVSVDGGYVTQVVSDSGGIVRYNYTSSWSPHTFEFDWFSDAGFTGAPDPTNIANTTGETWVRHSWSAGSGNVTDSYNVSVNSVWHNGSPAYYNNTGLATETWSNVTVWAYNNTGGISQNSISQNTQSDAAARVPSNTAAYFNNTAGYAIEITTKTDRTNLFSRTPTEADGNATSGNLVVTTT